MDKKRPLKDTSVDDLKGFEEFIESQPEVHTFLPKPPVVKKEVSFENLTFVSNDALRLLKIKDLLMLKIPFSAKYEQGIKIIDDQNKEISLLRKNLFEQCNKQGSAYRKSLREIFDSFFAPPRN